jgi:hypothetical protein
VARMGEESFGGKTRRRETTRKMGRRWKGGIRMDLKEIGWRCMDWIQPAQDRDRLRALVNTVTNLRVLALRR